MRQLDFYRPPEDSADLDCYSLCATTREILPAFGSAVPSRDQYSRKLPGLLWGDSDVLVLDAPSYARSAQTWRGARKTLRRLTRQEAARYDFLSAPRFVGLFSIPVWAALSVWLLSQIPL